MSMVNSLFPPLKVGGLVFDAPLIQAPLSGYSDAPMRRLARRFGASFALCEVFLDLFVLSVVRGAKSRFYLNVKDSDKPAGAQLIASPVKKVVAKNRRR